MTYFFIILLIALMFAALLSQIISLPGNWIILLLLGLWKWLGPDAPELTGQVFLMLVLMAAAGEGLEWGAQLWSGKRYGSSGFGNVGGILGAIVGALLGMPILFFVLRGGDKFSAFVDKGGKQAIMVVCTTM